MAMSQEHKSLRGTKRVAFLIAFLCATFAVSAQQTRHGMARHITDNSLQVFDRHVNQWTDVESFWLRYAQRNGGLTWRISTSYPPYDDVEENDTLLIELDQGRCLMEFYHSRWRRANDVRRWDDAFNAYGACPYVFD